MDHTDGTGESFLLEVEAEPQYVATARLFAAAVARHFACPEETVQDVKVAVSEACSNSIKAHQSTAVNEPIKIAARKEDDALRFEVADRGPGFDFDVSDLTEMPHPSELFESGVGLTLIHALFPEVDVRANRDGGTIVSFAVSLTD